MTDEIVQVEGFAEFTRQVAEKVSQGLDVTIMFDQSSDGMYMASVGLPPAGENSLQQEES